MVVVQTWTELEHYAYGSYDWDVSSSDKWALGLQLDPDHPDESIEYSSRPVGSAPFSPDGYPTWAVVKGRVVEGWDEEDNAACAPPQSPVASSNPLRDVLLIP
jgi:hypothetical protein